MSSKEEKEMKILHINSYYNTSRFYKSLYDKQVTLGHQIDVFVPVARGCIQSDSFDYGSYTSISLDHGKYDRILFRLKHAKIFNDICGKYNIPKYDIIHAHSLFSNGYIALRLKKKYGIPYVVAVRSADVITFFGKMIHLRRIGVEIIKNADRVIFLSRPYRDHTLDMYIPSKLKDEIDSKISIIPNGIDDFWFDNIPGHKSADDINEDDPGSADIRLLQVGNIDKNKNIGKTVDAVLLLMKKGVKVKLDVAGKIIDHRIYDKLRKLEFVRYLGYKSKQELINIYRDNHLFVLPSKRETFGLVYAEAMSQGLPVIYSRGQGFDGQFEDGEIGYSVNNEDASEIADSIIAAYKEIDEISGRCIQESKRFCWNDIAGQYEVLYIDVTSEYDTGLRK